MNAAIFCVLFDFTFELDGQSDDIPAHLLSYSPA